MTIIFYDIPSKAPQKAWSPSTWRARLALNIKGIPYKTEWVEECDIEAHAKEHGIPPTGKKPSDGSPFYTLPAIYDESTGTYLSDSVIIVEYLEKQYPDTPSLFPYNTAGLQIAFRAALRTTFTTIGNFTIPANYFNMNPPSQEYYRRAREQALGKKIEEMTPTGEEGVAQWAKVEKDFGVLDEWYSKNGGKGPFILGDTVSWADLVIAGNLLSFRAVFGENSQRWKDISSWHGGRWGNLLESLKEYQTVV